jgi:hypothetical protein
VARIDGLIAAALAQLPGKPDDKEERESKKAFSESLSHAIARAIADELRDRGLKDARPAPPGTLDRSGAERRMAGGIGAKKVDVTWATEESGLILGVSIKSINFRDRASRNFQKNLTNRRDDMLFEGVTLHRRFPYSVLAGLFFLDADAALDNTAKRRSTFENAHARLRLFTGRDDPGGRDEQYEHMFILLLDSSSVPSSLRTYAVGDTENTVSMEEVMNRLVASVALRNPDFYECVDGRLKSINA